MTATVLTNQPGPVPAWAKAARPHLTPKVWGPPPGHEDTVGSVEMLSGWEDDGTQSWPIQWGYIPISAEDAQKMVEAGGGMIEVGFFTGTLYPWATNVYAVGSEDPDHEGDDEQNTDDRPNEVAALHEDSVIEAADEAAGTEEE